MSRPFGPERPKPTQRDGEIVAIIALTIPALTILALALNKIL